MEQHHRHSPLSQEVQPELDSVLQMLHALGRDDGPFLQSVISALVLAPTDMLRPTVALLAAHALGRHGDPPLIRFAAALQIVYAASLAHRPSVEDGAGAEHDHLTVLAGDYLYAQAAMLTASLEQLTIMSMLSATIMSICRSEASGIDAPVVPCAADPQTSADGGLFRLSAAGAAVLCSAEASLVEALASFGQLLDSIWNRHAADDPVVLSGRARDALQALPSGAARQALLDLVDDVLKADGTPYSPSRAGESALSASEPP
ncbi:MAG TPA: hypothetical protein VHB98_19940 [Chloroflexota bacterium]|nr:hypothetical protein [Chloroflexota bacterium]